MNLVIMPVMLKVAVVVDIEQREETELTPTLPIPDRVMEAELMVPIAYPPFSWVHRVEQVDLVILPGVKETEQLMVKPVMVVVFWLSRLTHLLTLELSLPTELTVTTAGVIPAPARNLFVEVAAVVVPEEVLISKPVRQQQEPYKPVAGQEEPEVADHTEEVGTDLPPEMVALVEPSFLIMLLPPALPL